MGDGGPQPLRLFTLAQRDPAIAKLIADENRREHESMRLIASENYASRAVMEKRKVSGMSLETVISRPAQRACSTLGHTAGASATPAPTCHEGRETMLEHQLPAPLHVVLVLHVPVLVVE